MNNNTNSIFCEDSSKELKTMGLIKIKDLLNDIALLKKYAIEVDSEPIYLCADHIEEQLNKLRYGDHELETSWR